MVAARLDAFSKHFSIHRQLNENHAGIDGTQPVAIGAFERRTTGDQRLATFAGVTEALRERIEPRRTTGLHKTVKAFPARVRSESARSQLWTRHAYVIALRIIDVHIA